MTTPDTPTPHRATEDEWRGIEYMRQPIEIAPGVHVTGGKWQSIASCILELRDTLAATRCSKAARVAALERGAVAFDGIAAAFEEAAQRLAPSCDAEPVPPVTPPASARSAASHAPR